ncbi:MAG: serine hydrolase domain-containing protein [Candidatus Thorarchaeota archaeon]
MHSMPTNELRDLCGVLMNQFNVPAVSLSVVRNGKTVHNLGMGIAGGDSNQPVSVQTRFRASSLSKPVFTFAVFKLIKQGILSLDEPLSNYFPERYVNDSRIEKISARHVFTHSTGFPNWARNRELTIDFAPGTRFEYSGEGFGYLQKVVEYILDEPLADMMDRLVHNPLGMKDSSYAPEEVDRVNTATGHDQDGKPYHGEHMLSEPHAAGSLVTTPSDYSRFLMQFCVKPKTEDEQIAFSMMDVQKEKGFWNIPVRWCHSLGLQTTPLGDAIFHWGIETGFRSFAIKYLQQDLSIQLFANADLGLHLANKLLTTLIGEKPVYFP